MCKKSWTVFTFFLIETMLPCVFGVNIELIHDPRFEQGLAVLSPVHGKKVVVGTLATIEQDTLIWQLAQWHSQYCITGVQRENLPDGGVRFSNVAKSITIGLGALKHRDITLAMDSRLEYDGKLRTQGQPWPHLLVEQSITNCPSVADLAGLHFHIESRLLYAEIFRPKGYTRTLHCAQVPFVLTIQNRNPESKGYGDFLWFIVPIYDDRDRIPQPHIAQDTADPSAKLIYNPGGAAYTDQSCHDGQWITINCDLLPFVTRAIETAWQKGYLTDSRDLNDYLISSMSLGWEVTGLARVAIQFRALSLMASTEGEIYEN
ncbi:MAG: hypothetical protein JXA82_08250 [Sedimentisphaerales bacterium]|nr:hypothetical protein [Sedimentisphaerales bacterium]